jgi:hypothetical protein
LEMFGMLLVSFRSRQQFRLPSNPAILPVSSVAQSHFT